MMSKRRSTRFQRKCSRLVSIDKARIANTRSKGILRDSDALKQERDLKTADLQNHSNVIMSRSTELAKKKGEQDRRNRDEAALRELRAGLAALQAELKVRLQSYNADKAGPRRDSIKRGTTLEGPD
jgi:myosin heavy subunit